jgi:hypothetical protein
MNCCPKLRKDVACSKMKIRAFVVSFVNMNCLEQLCVNCSWNMVYQLIQLLYCMCVQLVSRAALLLLGSLASDETPERSQWHWYSSLLYSSVSQISPVHFRSLTSVVGFKGRTWTEGVWEVCWGESVCQKRDEVVGGSKKTNYEEHHNSHSSPSIIRIIKSRKMWWGGHLTRMGEKRNA